jgi:PAS domain-containing protein
VTWGGDPFTPAAGDDPAMLSPRRSFAQWHQVVEKTSDPWTRADRIAARLIGETVADVVLQFRSLRVLIAQDQLEQIRRQVRSSEQPVIVADPSGRILLINEAFEQLSRPSGSPMQQIADLADMLSPTGLVREHLRQLVANRKSWRGEVTMTAAHGEAATRRHFLVRADPVFSAPSRVLGFVFLFTDLTERRAADAARERFQEGILSGQRPWDGRLDSKADLLYQNLLSAVIENAQLAALEITDGVETTRMPELLDGVRESVNRTAEVLEHLIWHAIDTEGGNPDGGGG